MSVRDMSVRDRSTVSVVAQASTLEYVPLVCFGNS